MLVTTHGRYNSFAARDWIIFKEEATAKAGNKIEGAIEYPEEERNIEEWGSGVEADSGG